MPTVDPDTLLLVYNLKVDHLKGLIGAEHPAHKLFKLVSEICKQFEKLQHRDCTKEMRHDYTTIILTNLSEIVTGIDQHDFPETARDEYLLMFEYAENFYLLHDVATELIQHYVDYQSSIDSFYPLPSPPPQRHHTTASRGKSPQASSSSGGHYGGGHYGGARSPRERSPARRAPAPRIKLWSLEEIEAKNPKLLDAYHSRKVFRHYVDSMVKKFKSESKTRNEKELTFMTHAMLVDDKIRILNDNGRLEDVGRGSRFDDDTSTRSYRDPMGESDKIVIYTTIQESLQIMSILISDGEVDDLKTYKYDNHTYDMSTIVNTIMRDAAKEIIALQNRFNRRGPRVEGLKADMHTLLLRLQNIKV
jgi:hypothetical protein